MTTPEEQKAAQEQLQKQMLSGLVTAVGGLSGGLGKWAVENSGVLFLSAVILFATFKLTGDSAEPTTKIQWQWPIAVKVQWPVVRVPITPTDDTTNGKAPFEAPGLAVLIVEEVEERGKLTKEQLNALSSQELRDWLNANCIVSADGKTREWKVWDKDQDMTYATPMWKSAMAVPRQSVPWIVISNGKSGFSGPLPSTQAELLATLNKFKAGGK